MWYSKVTAILDVSDYSEILNDLKILNIPGISISHVQGFGDYINNYNDNGLVDSIKIEIFTSSDQADEISQLLSLAGNEMTEGGGLVAIEPVSKLMNVKKVRHELL